MFVEGTGKPINVFVEGTDRPAIGSWKEPGDCRCVKLQQQSRKGKGKMTEGLHVEDIFASKVFTLGKMKERLPKGIYKEVAKVIDQGGELSRSSSQTT